MHPRRRPPVPVLLALVAALVAPSAAGAAHRPIPRLTALRCVPATATGCARRPSVRIGRQVQLRGRGLVPGLRVTFRWSRGALATRLQRNRAGYVARVPAGVAVGTVSVTVRDRAGRRSNALRLRIVAPPPVVAPPAATAPGPLPAAFQGSGMWIWQLPRSEGGDVAAIGARARAAGVRTVFVKSADGSVGWDQFNADLVRALHAQGLLACAWQFVYGGDPGSEARLGAQAVAAGADCLVADAESQYEGRYGAAQRYVTELRAAIGPAYPLGLTSFPYVDYHPGLPYSVFLGPGAAQANLPQVYWKDIGGTVDAVSAHAWAHNRLYGVPVAPIGQTYQSPGNDEVQRFRAVWAGYGAAGLSWWSWQATGAGTWPALGPPDPAPAALPDPGWPALGKGAKGDEVVWLQQHLASGDPRVTVSGVLDDATVQALRDLQTAKGLPVTGTTDPATWGQLLALPVKAVDWSAAPPASAARARSARRRAEIPERGRGG